MTPPPQVLVKRLPERMVMSGAAAFSREVKPFLRARKPRVVFDCSEVRRLDSAGAAALLECLDEAIKQDGDIKLAAVSNEMNVILQAVKIGRIFQIFDTVGEAEMSFRELTLPASNSNHLLRWLTSVRKKLGQKARKRERWQLPRSEAASARRGPDTIDGWRLNEDTLATPCKM
jgi:anti-sigma B factor antagonist